MKYDLAKLMHEALKENKKIFKKADEEESELEKHLKENARRIENEPSAYEFTIQEFLDLFFETKSMMGENYKLEDHLVFKSNADLTLFFEHLYEAKALNELIDRGFFKVNNSSASPNPNLLTEKPMSFEFAYEGKVMEALWRDGINTVIKIYHLFWGLQNTPYKNLLHIKGPSSYSYTLMTGLRHAVCIDLVRYYKVGEKLLTYKRKVTDPLDKAIQEGNPITKLRDGQYKSPQNNSEVHISFKDDLIGQRIPGVGDMPGSAQLVFKVTEKNKYKTVGEAKIQLQVVFEQDIEKAGPLPEIRISTSDTKYLASGSSSNVSPLTYKDYKSFKFFESENVYEDAVHHLDNAFAQSKFSIQDILYNVFEVNFDL